MSDLCVILCTCPSMETAKLLAQEAVANRLAACVNIVPSMTSIYWWDDSIQEDQECQIILKSNRVNEQELREKILSIHPYDTPEWLVFDVNDSSPDYADWIRSTIK